MTTEVIPHGQAFCLVRNRPIPKQDRLAGATCPFCTVQLPPKNRKMLVTVDEEDNVISSSIRFNRPRLGRGVSVVERCERTVMSDQFDGLGLPGRFVATHPRRVRWHSRHGDPDGVSGEALSTLTPDNAPEQLAAIGHRDEYLRS